MLLHDISHRLHGFPQTVIEKLVGGPIEHLQGNLGSIRGRQKTERPQGFQSYTWVRPAGGTEILSSAQLVRQPELQVVASSNLSFTKGISSSNLKGQIIVENGDIGAIEQGGSAIAQLNVREINADGIETVRDNDSGLGPIDLDLVFQVPGKLFIRSYGLDSEWQADLIIKGTSDQPIVAVPS